MPNMTLAIPVDLKQKMDQHKEINWSEVARQAIREKMLLLEKMNRMLLKSELGLEDIQKHAVHIKNKILRKHKAA